jgi:hypothetical protein
VSAEGPPILPEKDGTIWQKNGRETMPDMTAHERFLRGEPLTPELAAVREGRDPEPARRPALVERRAYDDPERPLNRAERLDLKEWHEMPGQKLYQRIAEKAIHFHEKRAISLSCDDPLNKRDEVANAWAYFNMFRRVVAELETVINAELAELENEQ